MLICIMRGAVNAQSRPSYLGFLLFVKWAWPYIHSIIRTMSKYTNNIMFTRVREKHKQCVLPLNFLTFFVFVFLCWAHQSSKLTWGSWLGGSHTTKLNHHLINSSGIQLLEASLFSAPALFSLFMEWHTKEKCVCVCLCVTVQRCCKRTVTRLRLALTVPTQILSDWQ